MDCCIPKQQKLSNGKSPYTNHKVIDLKHKKESLLRKYCFTGYHLDYFKFTQARNSLRSLTCTLRTKLESKVANNVKSNPKAFWSYVNSKIKVKASIPTLVDDGTDRGIK